MEYKDLVSFKEYKEVSNIITEATVNASKYGPGSLFVLKGAKADAFSKKIGSAIKLPSNPVFSKLDPNNVPDTAVVIGDSSKPLQAAFEILGKVAMQELMTHPVVNAEAEKFTEYLDEGKLSQVME